MKGQNQCSKKFLSNSVTNVLARQVTFRPSYVSEGQAESFFFQTLKTLLLQILLM